MISEGPRRGWEHRQVQAIEAAFDDGAQAVYPIPAPVSLESLQEINAEAQANGFEVIGLVLPEVGPRSEIGLVSGVSWRIVHTNPNPDIQE